MRFTPLRNLDELLVLYLPPPFQAPPSALVVSLTTLSLRIYVFFLPVVLVVACCVFFFGSSEHGNTESNVVARRSRRQLERIDNLTFADLESCRLVSSTYI